MEDNLSWSITYKGIWPLIEDDVKGIKLAHSLSTFGSAIFLLSIIWREKINFYWSPEVEGEHHPHRNPEGDGGGDDSEGFVHNKPEVQENWIEGENLIIEIPNNWITKFCLFVCVYPFTH